jgi:hypothetical protein
MKIQGVLKKERACGSGHPIFQKAPRTMQEKIRYAL